MGFELNIMEYKDDYQILGVARNANASEIKAAYRNWPCSITPTATGDKQRKTLEEMNEAYQVLLDPQSAARYDRWRFILPVAATRHTATSTGTSGPASRAEEVTSRWI